MATQKQDNSSSSSQTGVSGVHAESASTPWWNVSGWRLRSKIALALAIPMIAASWFAVDKSMDEWVVQQDQKATAGQIRVLEPTLEYLYAAETATVIARSETDSESAARTEAVEDVRAAADKVESQLNDENLTANQKAQLAGLVALSDGLRDGRAYETLQQSVSQVRQLHNGVADFYQTIINGQNSPEPVLQQIGYVMEGRLALTLQQLQVAYTGNKITNPSQVFSALGVEDAAIAQLSRARDEAPEVLDLRSLNALRFDTVEQGEGELDTEDALALYDELTTTVLDESTTALDESASAARSTALTNIAILAAALLVSLLLGWLIARLVLNPVRRLRDGARDVASTKLPQAVATIGAGGTPGPIEPINVHTNEEVGQLARAVDELHQTAVDLAQGQAQLRTQIGEMFVTLSRRNTSLINQQLGLIEELERDEEDPRRLESLFRLDHLAARMRRTAESLVILSDAPIRQREMPSLSVNDALQAATAGVQEYQRVEMRGASTDHIVGAVGNDVVHMLTELIDNALAFSPPTETVNISTTGGSGQTIISISDGGLGLPEDVLIQLNGMLHADVGITPDAARRMGLFVVSRLAHRHGIDVKLAKNGRGGVTASVSISDNLLVGGASTTPSLLDEAPVQVIEPVVETVDAPAPESDYDPLTGPLMPEEPAEDRQVDQINAAISAVTGLPKRRPGATASGRDAAISPMAGGSLFSSPAAAPEAPAETESESEGGLPKRRPGATVPGREAAVNPTGSSLFAAPDVTPDESAAPVSMFGRSAVDQDEESKTQSKSEGGALGIFSRRDALITPGEVDDALLSPPAPNEAGGSPDEVPATEAEATAPEAEAEATAPEVEENPQPETADVETPQSTVPVVESLPAAQTPEVKQDAPAAAVSELPTRTPGAEESSNWLSKEAPTSWGSSTTDAGWRAAHRASESETSTTTNTGLPQRQPGRRLVPGAVAPTKTAPPRDPEAIRKRLAAHAAGVSRGRTATATTPNTDKEGPA